MRTFLVGRPLRSSHACGVLISVWIRPMASSVWCNFVSAPEALSRASSSFLDRSLKNFLYRLVNAYANGGQYIAHPFFGTTTKFSGPKWQKLTNVASFSKRPPRCKNGYGHVAWGLVAPSPRMVSKIRGKTGISHIWDILRDDNAAGA
jgi:hypothetical protein